MNQKELILHQKISVAWHNVFVHDPLMFQRLLCQWNNAPTKAYGNKMRTMGVKSGVSDWLFLDDCGKCIWIELKVDDNKQSPDQIKFENLCNLLRHKYVICRDYESFWEIIGIKPS